MRKKVTGAKETFYKIWKTEKAKHEKRRERERAASARFTGVVILILSFEDQDLVLLMTRNQAIFMIIYNKAHS